MREPPSFPAPERRSGATGARWRDLLRDGEIRVVSGPADAPYAVTVLYLSGQVIVQVEQGFWLETPGPLREEAIRAHVEQVREEFSSLGSPAARVRKAVLALRAGVALGNGGLALGYWVALGAQAAVPISAFGVLAGVAWLVPRRWIVRAVQPLVVRSLRRLLLRGVRS